MSTEALRCDVISCGSDADRIGTKETVTADDVIIVGLLLEGSCTRADVFKESVATDMPVEGKRDTDVGQIDDRPRIKIPLELSYGPSMRPAERGESNGPRADDLSGGPQLEASRPPPLSSLDGLNEAHVVVESNTPPLLAQICSSSLMLSLCLQLRLRLPPRGRRPLISPPYDCG